eukprot:SAG25_NODE_33_length_20262_cov_33.203293_9_plen_109_part_00
MISWRGILCFGTDTKTKPWAAAWSSTKASQPRGGGGTAWQQCGHLASAYRPRPAQMHPRGTGGCGHAGHVPVMPPAPAAGSLRQRHGAQQGAVVAEGGGGARGLGEAP